MKIIIYALGRVFEHYKEKIDWNQVIALSDKEPESVGEIHGLRIISPDRIRSLEYDFIAIFSNKLFEEIKMELAGKYFIPQDKIIPWKAIITDEGKMASTSLQYAKIFCKERKCKRLLDIGMSVLPKYCLTGEEFFAEEGGVIDGLKGKGMIDNENLYHHVYDDFGMCDCNYDAVLFWDELQCTDIMLRKVMKQTKYILIYTGYLKESAFVKEAMKERLQQYGKVKCIAGLECLFWIIDTQDEKRAENISIHVVVHKNYNVFSDSLYKPLCVGGYDKKEYQTEKAGENIAYLNQKINECTALYWIWKNTDTKFVGMNHYRRYFYNNDIISMDNYLDMMHASQILKEYDIILPKVYPLDITVFEQIYRSMDQELCRRGYALFRSKMEKWQPDYLEAFDSVMSGHASFLCNLFVTRRDILNRYCEWLFSFLLETAEEINVEGYDDYSKRVIGFLAERMWTVWLRKNRLNIKELPYVAIR